MFDTIFCSIFICSSLTFWQQSFLVSLFLFGNSGTSLAVFLSLRCYFGLSLAEFFFVLPQLSLIGWLLTMFRIYWFCYLGYRQFSWKVLKYLKKRGKKRKQKKCFLYVLEKKRTMFFLWLHFTTFRFTAASADYSFECIRLSILMTVLIFLLVILYFFFLSFIISVRTLLLQSLVFNLAFYNWRSAIV